MRTAAITCCLILIGTLGSCSRSDQTTKQQEAEAKARQAGERLHQDAKQLGHEVKQQAHELNAKIGAALSGSGATSNNASQAEEKLERGGRDLNVEAGKAGVKLDHASLIAKVKAKLAADVGLSTVTGINVDAAGQVITLNGTVYSVQQKQLAEQAALQVTGVARVIDNLQVQQ